MQASPAFPRHSGCLRRCRTPRRSRRPSPLPRRNGEDRRKRTMPLAPETSDGPATTKRCLRCGYSLKDNGDSRNCPECGLAVRISFHASDALEWSNPAWVRRLACATALLALANAGVLASLAITAIGG